MGIFRKDTDTGQAAALPFNTHRPLTAAAVQMKLKDKGEADQFKRRRQSDTAVWQSEAWEYYDAIGEIKYAFNLVASVVSRIRLYAAVIDDPAESPVPIRTSQTVDPALADAAQRALDRLDSAYGGQAGLLRDAALNLSVAGECFLVQIPARPGSGLPETWDIRSVDELQITQENQYIVTPRRDMASGGVGMRGNVAGAIILPPSAFVGRIWRSHPRYSEEPDGSLRGILDLCAELLLLNRTFRATARSRLNAGAMYIPDGLSNASGGDPEFPTDMDGELTPEEQEDDFEDQLIDAMTTPISDESSASAVVPLIIRGPAELGEKIKIFKFERSFDPALAARADRVLERILQGLDVPKDVVTGLANVKYSNAVQIDESLYKAHIEPLLLLISDAITQVYLRPYLRSIGYSEAEVKRVVVWYDPSAVATRNDRASDADAGYDKLAISGDTYRRAHGFSDADAPSANELVLRMLSDKGSFSPELTEALLTAVAPEIMAATKAAAQNANVAPVPAGVQDVLNGGQGTPTEPVDPAAPADPVADPAAAAPAEDAVGPGEDAPPVDLAEPTP